MNSINRMAVVIRPKAPFAQWVNNLPDMNGRVMSLEDLQQDCLVVLIPAYDRTQDAAAHVKEIYREIFGEELWGICTREEWFPPQQDWKTFQQWFDIEIHSVVMDTLDEEIEKEED